MPREWHDTLRTTLAALGFAPSTADLSLFLCTDTSLLAFYILMYVDDLVFATAETEALILVKSELQKRHTCTDLGELSSYLGLQSKAHHHSDSVTHGAAGPSALQLLVLQRFAFQFSLPQPTPLSTGHSLSAPPWDESVEPSGPYPELVGCLICESEIYAGAMAARELRWLAYLTWGSGLQCGQLRLSYVASRDNTADVFTNDLGSGDHQRFCTPLGLVPTLPHLLVA
ncbi:unnamed protein product [Closterium sp. NIES-53]